MSAPALLGSPALQAERQLGMGGHWPVIRGCHGRGTHLVGCEHIQAAVGGAYLDVAGKAATGPSAHALPTACGG